MWPSSVKGKAAEGSRKVHKAVQVGFEAMLFVGIGGFLGANARFLLSGLVTNWVYHLTGLAFPYATMVVNMIGSFLLALFIGLIGTCLILPENTRLLVSVGFFGAFTTFSTYALESILLMRDGNWFAGLANIVLTNGLCLLAVLAGLWLANRW